MPMSKFEYKYTHSFEKYHAFRSDNPIQDIWNSILKFCDISYLSKVWEKRPIDEYIYVSTCIKQAHEYYIASKTVTLNTKPELLYYSFLNLTKAILFLINDKEPPEYHGIKKLRQKNGTEKIKIIDNADILNYSVVADDGVFLSLADTLGANIKKGQLFTLSNFCNNTIELLPDFYSYYTITGKIIVPTVEVWSNGVIKIKFSNNHFNNIPDLIERIKETTGILNDFNILVNDIDGTTNTRNLTLTNDSYFDKDDFENDVSNILEKHFLFSVFNDDRYYLNLNDLKIPNILSYYGIMFLLSCLVRYEPVLLHSILGDNEKSSRWFYNKICDVSERVYPNLILNTLYRQKYKYSSGF